MIVVLLEEMLNNNLPIPVYSIIKFCVGDPITTEAVRYGMRVGAVVLPANPMLKTAEALKFVGPKAFGFDMSYREPHPLLGQHM